MSLAIRILAKGKKLKRDELLELRPEPVYDDGRTKQSFKDETDINMIMERAAQGGTISHLAKFEGMYADFSDFDFHEHTRKLTEGREVFDSLPAEIRREFSQSPAQFFAYVNDPANINDLAKKLPGLARPGTQLPKQSENDANQQAAQAAADAPVASPPSPTTEVASSTPSPSAGETAQ